MKKPALTIAALLISTTFVHAEEYMFLKCSDVLDQPNWAAHVVGWLNLENRTGQSQKMDFMTANREAMNLTRTCLETPDSQLWQAVNWTFGDLDDENQIVSLPAPKTSNEIVSSLKH